MKTKHETKVIERLDSLFIDFDFDFDFESLSLSLKFKFQSK